MKLTTALQMLWSMSSGYRKFLLAHVLTGMVRILLSLAFIAVSKQIVDVATRHTDGRLSTGISLLIGCMLLQLVLSGLTNPPACHCQHQSIQPFTQPSVQPRTVQSLART